MSTRTIQDFISDNTHILSLPSIVIKLKELLDDDNIDFSEIAKLIQLDAALTAQLLKIVNSSHYSFSKKIDTVSEAITIIGVNDLYHLVMATKVIKKFNKIPVALISPKTFWRHNIACAVAAKLIATEFNIKNSERFFILGLLHDIGKLAMYLSQPRLCDHILDRLKSGDNDRNTIDEIEKIAFGFSHDEIGAELLKSWQLPESIYIPIQYHHTPESATNFQQETSILHLANAIANLIENPLSYDDALPMKPEIWKILKVESQLLIPLTNSADINYRDVVSLILGDVAA